MVRPLDRGGDGYASLVSQSQVKVPMRAIWGQRRRKSGVRACGDKIFAAMSDRVSGRVVAICERQDGDSVKWVAMRCDAGRRSQSACAEVELEESKLASVLRCRSERHVHGSGRRISY